ncbi:MAG: ATP-binding protein [Bacillota bacterium]|jgi:signal transduction histidine kinase
MQRRGMTMHTRALVVVFVILAGMLLITMPHIHRDPPVKDGVLDLRGWEPQTNPMVFVAGEFEFYWGRLLDPGDFGPAQPMTWYAMVPQTWSRYIIEGKRLPAKGYATYSFTLLTDGTGETLALNIPAASTAYNLWIDDELKVSVGKVGTSPETTIADEIPKYVEFVDDRVETRITIQVANYLHRRGGLWTRLELGAKATIESVTERRLLVDASSFGALCFMGIYHICLFAQRRRDKSNLHFGLFCLAFSVRALFVGQKMAARVWPDLSWELEIALHYVASSALLPLAAAYVETSYPEDTRFSVTRFATAGWIAFASISLTTSPRTSTALALYYETFDAIICIFVLLVLVSATRNKRFGSQAMALGGLISMGSFALDFLYLEGLLHFGNFSQPGLVLLCFTQSYSLSVRFTRTMETVERLSEELSLTNKELIDLNRHLEERVDMRTSELLESNQKLEAINNEIARMDEARRHLLGNIAHDLRTPVTLIRGYAEAILDGVVEGQENQTKYLELMRAKVDSLTGLIEDLFELTQLESRRTAFNPQPVDVLDLIEKLYSKYEHDIERAGLTPRLVLPETHHGQAPSYVSADPDRIDRVLANLLFNAIKFSPKNGEIMVGCSVGPGEATVIVQDSGLGIPEGDIPFIFDRFYKSPRSRTSSAGSGLGLAIAKEIVALHNGRIWVESQLGKGTKICFTLPIIPAPPDLNPEPSHY